MKVRLDKLDDQFLQDEFEIAGEPVILVHPKHLYAKWRRDTLKFRSSVWTCDGDPVSLSFPKFFNWGEFTEVVPVPTFGNDGSESSIQAVEKMDGSTLIVSRFKGETIIRTRGTVDARSEVNNGEEIDYLQERYPEAFALPVDHLGTANISYLFEWVTDDPDSKLVVRYTDTPKLFLIGVVNHEHYTLYSQSQLDELAAEIQVDRPVYHEFDSLAAMLEDVAGFEGVEGVCLYFNGGQDIVKIKSDWYLKLHRLKSNFQGVESVIDLFIDLDCPDFNSAYQYLVENIDFETAEACRGHLSSICDVMKEVGEIQHHMKEAAAKIAKSVSQRELQIERVYQSYGKTNRAQMVIDFLDGKDALSRDQVKKLIYQSMV